MSIIGNEFTWDNTLMVAWVVFFFSLGLIPEVLIVFLNRVFFATKDTVRPLVVAVFTVVAGIVTGILFTNYFSHFNTFSLKILYWEPSYFFSKGDGMAAVGGLALSSSLVYSLTFIFLFVLLLRKMGSLDLKKFWLVVLRKVAYGLAMAIFMYTLLKMWDQVLDTARTINLLVLTFSTIIPGICLYLWLGYISKDPDVGMIDRAFAMIKEKIGNGKQKAEERN